MENYNNIIIIIILVGLILYFGLKKNQILQAQL
jgi:hypothetical protein